jgi:hypothetical protein
MATPTRKDREAVLSFTYREQGAGMDDVDEVWLAGSPTPPRERWRGEHERLVEWWKTMDDYAKIHALGYLAGVTAAEKVVVAGLNNPHLPLEQVIAYLGSLKMGNL